MEIIETHAHIYSDQFKDDISETIDRAKESGVQKIFMPNIDSESIDAMMEMEHQFPDYCVPMMGLHPCSVDKHFEKELYVMEQWLSKREFCAIGEIGTDLYWNKSLFEYQKEALKIQCTWAKEKNLPIIIHCRESMDETIEIVRDNFAGEITGIFHCFNGTIEQANEITSMGFKLGLGGVCTYKNAKLDPMINGVDINDIVLETDCPYLSPTPHRGKRNEPSYISFVLEHIAGIKNMSVDELARRTTTNALEVFQIINNQ